MEAAGSDAWLWLAINGIVGLPLALALLVVLRELVRAGVALAFGFRVFEIRWGAGPRLAERPVGPLNLALGTVPVAGAAITRSGFPRRHRIARLLIALAPALLQLAWLVLRTFAHASPFDALSQGPAMLATLDLANVLLLALQLFIPVRVSPEIRTDIRLFLDASLGDAQSDRIARASYYARLARHRIERADVRGASAALEQGLVQLGREPMLVACEQRMRATEMSSVIDQGDCADAFRILIEAAESEDEARHRRGSIVERARRGGLMATPILALAICLVGWQADRIANAFESRWLRASEQVADEASAERCAELIEGWARWAQRVDSWLPPDPFERSDRHLAFSRLELCRGDLAAAAEHRGEAMLAANAARSEMGAAILEQPGRWLEIELRLTELLRHAAAVEADRRAFREALIAITNAERRLETVERQVGLWPEPAARDRAEATLAAERDALFAMRDRVMSGIKPR